MNDTFSKSISKKNPKKLHRALQQLQEKYLLLLNMPHAGVIIIDTNGRIVEINQKGISLLGFNPDTLKRKSLFDLFSFVSIDAGSLQEIHSIQLHDEPGNFEFTFINKQHRELFIHLYYQPIKKKKDITGFVILLHDSTTEKLTEQALEQKYKEIRFLKRSGELFNSSLKLDKVLATILNNMRNLFNVIYSSLWIINPDTNLLECQHALGPGSEMVKGYKLKLGQGIAGWVAKNSKSVIVSDALFDKRYHKKVDKKMGVQTRSFLTVPLTINNKTFGVIQLIDTTPHRFNQNDLTLLESFASSAAIAIHNATLYKQIKTELRENKANQKTIEQQKSLLQEEKEILSIASKMATKLAISEDLKLEKVLHTICTIISKTIHASQVLIVMNKNKLIADSEKVITLPWRSKKTNNGNYDFYPENLTSNKTLKIKLFSDTRKMKLWLVTVGDEDRKFSRRDIKLLTIISNAISLALEVAILEDRNKRLAEITSKFIHINPDKFKNKLKKLNNKPFLGTYLIAQIINQDSSKNSQSKIQNFVKQKMITYGAIWVNIMGDTVHAIFSDYFNKTKTGELCAGFIAGIQISKELTENFDCILRIGISHGKLRIDQDALHMSQVSPENIIDQSTAAQEGRTGISTLQHPSEKLISLLQKKGFTFKQTNDLVHGTVKAIWKVYPQKKTNLKEANDATKKILPYETTLKILLTKGVCGHGHFEGGPITPKIAHIIKKVGTLYDKKHHLATRFEKLTGKNHKEILSKLNSIQSWGESRRSFEFVKHFLPWLFIMKLGQASSPDIIYELIRAELTRDLEKYAGVTREIYPLVWIEMGLDYDACVDAFVHAVSDTFKNDEIHGPHLIGTGIKRQFLEKKLSRKDYPFLAHVEYPYLKSLEPAIRLNEKAEPDKFNVYANVIDLARKYPLLNHKESPTRAQHTKRLFTEAHAAGILSHVHLLEELIDTQEVHGVSPESELVFIIKLFESLGITQARFIHMAYWKKHLPFLQNMKRANHQIAVCPTSTKMLGAMHTPESPQFFKNEKILNGILFDEKFPQIIISTDDPGPFSIRNVWDEILITHHDVTEWHSKDKAHVLLLQLLRNDYNRNTPKEIEKKYSLHRKAVSWAMGYDIFETSNELKDSQIFKKAAKRGKELLEKRNSLL